MLSDYSFLPILSQLPLAGSTNSELNLKVIFQPGCFRDAAYYADCKNVSGEGDSHCVTGKTSLEWKHLYKIVQFSQNTTPFIMQTYELLI